MTKEYILDKLSGEYVLVCSESSRATIRLGTDDLETAKKRAQPYIKFND
jgi:hypothetical protein